MKLFQFPLVTIYVGRLFLSLVRTPLRNGDIEPVFWIP
jgi:hypothetical protein